MAEPAKRGRLRAALSQLAIAPLQALRWLRSTLTPGIETRQLMLKAAGRALLGVGLIWWNPFDLFHKADEASSNLFQAFASILISEHVIPKFSDDSRKSLPITIVLFTPSAFDHINASLEPDPPWAWAPTFDRQAEVLRKIARYRPSAVFFDIEFYQQRGGEAAFHDAIAETTGVGASAIDCQDRNLSLVPGIPVLLAQPPAPQGILPELCKSGAVAVNVLWNGRPNTYPFMGRREVLSDVTDKNCEKTPESCFLKTPAAALFKFLCGKPQFRSAECLEEWTKDDGLNLIWRTGYDKLLELDYSGLLPAECGSWHPSPNTLEGQTSSKAETSVVTCPAPYVVNADHVVLDRSDGLDPALSKVFHDRIIMIGAEFPGMRDRVETSYGLVPGVFAHVAALDNLVSLGTGYVHAKVDEGFLSLNRFGQFWLVAALLFLIMYVIERLRRRAPSLAHLAHNQAPTGRHGYDAVLVLIAILGLIVGIAVTLLGLSLFFFFEWRMAPLNWIGELAIVWIFAFEETLYAILLVFLVFPLFSDRVRAFACHLVEKPEEKPHA